MGRRDREMGNTKERERKEALWLLEIDHQVVELSILKGR
jgi:hypothetical protein